MRTSNGVLTRSNSYFLFCVCFVLYLQMSEVAPRRLTVERPVNKSLDEVIASSTSSCRLCESNHTLQQCKAFRRLKPYKRLGVVRRYKYCINCLAQSDFLRNCRSRERCMECLGHHHTMQKGHGNQK